MLKALFVVSLAVLLIVSFLYALSCKVTTETVAHDFSFEKLASNKSFSLTEFKGSVILVVNTASHCGFTPQYKELENLYQRYKEKGFVILGIPSNDFGNQEAGNENDIKTFCTINYGVTFPMTTKVTVVGKDAHPFFTWLIKHAGWLGKPRWNFYKYLIGKDGKYITYFTPFTKPQSKKITNAVEHALNN